jgi:transcriptional regulator with XRE-family HTH domain
MALQNSTSFEMSTVEQTSAGLVQTLGARLRAAREAYGDSQVDLAMALGCTRAAVSQWETNETKPSSDKIQRIVARYSLSYEWLLFGKGRPPPELHVFGRGRSTIPELTRSAAAPSGWLIPPYALPSSNDNTIVFRAPADLEPIRNGDYVFVDRTQREIQLRGIWLVDMPNAGLALVRSRVAMLRKRPKLEIVCPDEAVFDPKSVKAIIGRVVARFTTYMVTLALDL